MSDKKPTAFSFKEYKVLNFTFADPEDASLSDLALFFSPSAIFKERENRIVVNLGLDVKDKEGTKTLVTCKFRFLFEFTDSTTLDTIPKYFWQNSLAIGFPYIRAFLTTLTTQAGVKAIILPLMNLTDLESGLKENTTVEAD